MRRASSPITLAGINHNVELLQILLAAMPHSETSVQMRKHWVFKLLSIVLFPEWIWRIFLRGPDDNGLTLDCGAKSFTYDECGRTPLHIACNHGQFDIANILIESCLSIEDKVAFVNAMDNDGVTALHTVKSRLFENLISLDYHRVLRTNLHTMQYCRLVQLLCLWSEKKDQFLDFVISQSYDPVQLRGLMHQPSPATENDIEEITKQLHDVLEGNVQDIEEAVRRGIGKYNEMTAKDRIQFYSERWDDMPIHKCGSCHRLLVAGAIGAIVTMKV